MESRLLRLVVRQAGCDLAAPIFPALMLHKGCGAGHTFT